MDDVMGRLNSASFDIEHALLLFATSYSTMPAQFIYEKEAWATYMDVINKCHIYMIGFQPKIDFVQARQDSDKVFLTFSILGKEYTIENPVPNGMTINQGKELYATDKQGNRYTPDRAALQAHLCREHNVVNFEVKYIGQAFGKDGSRNAIDRLLKHETLQKIVLKGIPEGYQITLLLLEVQPYNSLVTLMNPYAKNKNEGSSRIKSGIDKLFETTEEERTSIYEAALIRYFSPQFNKEFKNSFPSTNLKILQNCYEKDFSAVVAEICIDELPFKLFSKSVESLSSHMAVFNLHEDKARQVFFGM